MTDNKDLQPVAIISDDTSDKGIEKDILVYKILNSDMTEEEISNISKQIH